MPEAIATTKRKFYKALDSLDSAAAGTSNTATRPSSFHATSQHLPTAKRVRRSLSITSSIRPVSQYDKATGAEAKPSPNFSPWSHETFLARLKTFSSVSMWHPKPEMVNEVEWAKQGWQCVGVNTVACRGGCERRVIVKMDKTATPRQNKDTDTAEKELGAEDSEEEVEHDDHDDDSLQLALAERYKGLIINGHAETCMWHKAGCKDDIYRLQVVRPSIWQPELRTRYKSLLSIAPSTQDVTFKSMDSSKSHDLLQDLPNDLLNTSEDATHPTPEDAQTAFAIALHGWRGSSDSNNHLLHCDACFQRVGLWMYQPGYRPATRTATHEEDEDEDDTETPSVDLIEMHREHCPWRNAASQKSSGSLAGLNAAEILQRVVSTYARQQRRRSDEQRASTLQTGELDAEPLPASPAPSRAEVVQQDKERESRLRKLKSLFTIKRRSTVLKPPATLRVTR